MKPQIAWVVVGDQGLYYASNAETRKEAKRRHMDVFSYFSWEEARGYGDRVVKVKITEIKTKARKK